MGGGGVQVGGLRVSAPAKSWLLQTTKFLPPYATELPTSPNHATLRAHLGSFPSCSRWGPQKKGLRGLAAPPLPARGGRKRAAWRHRLQFPGPRLTLKWGKSGETSLVQPDVHPSKLPLRGSLSWKGFHTLPGRRSIRCGVRVRGGDYTQRCLSGAVGQVGAVLSAPVAQPPPQMPTKPPPCPSLSGGSFRPLVFPDLRTSPQNDGDWPPRSTITPSYAASL